MKLGSCEAMRLEGQEAMKQGSWEVRDLRLKEKGVTIKYSS
jgi:hypothetical protein